jgi:hypothetical protein
LSGKPPPVPCAKARLDAQKIGAKHMPIEKTIVTNDFLIMLFIDSLGCASLVWGMPYAAFSGGREAIFVAFSGEWPDRTA